MMIGGPVALSYQMAMEVRNLTRLSIVAWA